MLSVYTWSYVDRECDFSHACDFSMFVNREGMALLKFRSGVDFDPYGVFNTWDPKDDDPCNWSGIYCSDDRRVEIL